MPSSKSDQHMSPVVHASSNVTPRITRKQCSSMTSIANGPTAQVQPTLKSQTKVSLQPDPGNLKTALQQDVVSKETRKREYLEMDDVPRASAVDTPQSKYFMGREDLFGQSNMSHQAVSVFAQHKAYLDLQYRRELQPAQTHKTMSPGNQFSLVTQGPPLNELSTYKESNEPSAQQRSIMPAPTLILQPITSPISQEQLIAEVKGIYAGLVMVEGKCLQVDANQSQLVKDAPQGQPPRLDGKQYQALIALHKTLLYEHHDFLLASQHPSATAMVNKLAATYAMPARLWKYGIHSLLELLRTRLPESIEHMLSFIYSAYSFSTLLLETVPAFEGTWIECLGDLARYRMAVVEKDPEDESDSEMENIEDESDAEQKQLLQRENKDTEVRRSRLTAEEAKRRKFIAHRRTLNGEEKSQWTTVAFEWYVKARNANPEVGRLYHHLAILSQNDEIQQLFYYGKALTVSKPFEAARESVLILFRPAFGQRKWRHGALKVDKAFITMHATLFTKTLLFTKEELHRFGTELRHYCRRLKNYIMVKGRDFLEPVGFHMSIANANALIGYGNSRNPLMRVLQDPPEDVVMGEPPPIDLETFNMALEIFIGTVRAILNSNDDMTQSFLHCTLIFMAHLANSPAAVSMVKDFPWQQLKETLNSLMQKCSDYCRIQSDSVPMPEDGNYIPFREDIALRGLFWAASFYPSSLFEGNDIEREDQFLDNEAYYGMYRLERVLFSGVQLARRPFGPLEYCEVEHRFSLCTNHENSVAHSESSTSETGTETETTTVTLQDEISMQSVSSAWG